MAPLDFSDISSRLSHLSREDADEKVKNGKELDSDTSNARSGSGNNNNNNGGNNLPKFPLPCCIIQDNDPRAIYTGAWTLKGNGFVTQHVTTDPQSSVFLRFTGAGIAVFGVIPMSNDTVKPPTALYSIDGVPMPRMNLPFATSNIPNQPLFSTTSVLEVKEHTLVINITDATTPYTIQRFFVPSNGTTATSMISQMPPNGTIPGGPPPGTNTTSTGAKTSTTASWQMSPSDSSTNVDLQRTIRILAGILGALIFLILIGLILFGVTQYRSRRRKAKLKMEKNGSRRETTFSNWLTSTESILRNDSIFRSPPRSPYSRRSDLQRGRSPSVGRTSILDNAQAPPLPPKASLMQVITP